MSSKAQPRSGSALALLAADRLFIIGHRGYASIAPENTLPSFKAGLDAGADLIELDYQQSLDRVAIAIHDSTLDRTTNSRKAWRRHRVEVSSKTAEEIKVLDAGAWCGAEFAGARVPLLTEALEYILARGGVPLVEHKSGEAAAIANLLRERGWINRIVLMSFDWTFLHEFHQIEPRQALGALGPAAVLTGGRRASRFSRNLTRRWLKELQKTRATVAVWNHRVSRASVRLAHAQGLKVWVYTVDQPRHAVRLRRIGVDGIITNKIARIQKALKPIS